MALAGRSARRGAAGYRWIAIGLIVTLFVLLIDASLNSRSVAPQRQLAAGTWFDRVLPIITSSTEEGEVVSKLWSNGLQTSASSLASQIDGVVTGAYQNYQELAKLRPPVALTGQAGLLEACLLARSEALVSLKQAFVQTLGAAYPGANVKAPTVAPGTITTASAPVQGIQTAEARMTIGDQAYQLFLSSMPSNLGLSFPASSWLRDTSPYQPQAAQVYLTSLQNSVTTTPVYKLQIYAVTTEPSPVPSTGVIEVLPDASSLSITLVVANVGNQPEENLTVTAAVSPDGDGAASVRDFVNLEPGQAHSIVGLGPLNPPIGVPVTLTIDVTPPAGSATPVATESIVFEMPNPNAPPTTTTTIPPTTSTTPG